MSNSLREALEAAYEKTESEAETEVIEKVEPAADLQEPEGDVSSPEPEVPSEEDIEAPENWNSSDKETFKSQPKAVKEAWIRREKERDADYTRKNQARAEELRFAENIKKTLFPYDSFLKQTNLDPNIAVDRMMNAHVKLSTSSDTERAAYFKELARQYNVNLDPNAPQAPQVDPQIQAIWNQVKAQEQYIKGLEEQRHQEEERNIGDFIQSFASTKDEKGSLKYPHFERVRVDMGILFKAGKSKTLEEAYNQAILLDDELREKEFMTKRFREEDEKRKSASSKQTAPNVRSTSSSKVAEQTEKMTLRESLEQAYDAANKRR